MKNWEKWADENGLNFSNTKTQIVHFCKKHTCIKKPEIYLYNKKIKVTDQTNFIGVIFDKKNLHSYHILKISKTNVLKH